MADTEIKTGDEVIVEVVEISETYVTLGITLRGEGLNNERSEVVSLSFGQKYRAWKERGDVLRQIVKPSKEGNAHG